MKRNRSNVKIRSNTTQSQAKGELQIDSTVPIELMQSWMHVGRSQNQQSLRNPLTGFGTSRDPASYTEINDDEPEPLDRDSLLSLKRRSSIIQNILSVYPKESRLPEISTTEEINVNEIFEYFQNLESGSLQSVITDAAIEARLRGICWVLLGIDDGQDFNQPVDESSIEAILWFDILTIDQVIPVTKDTENYYFKLPSKQILQVHNSRLIPFYGDKPCQTELEDLRFTGVSIIQQIYDAFILYKPTLFSLAEILDDFSVFILGIEGLEQKRKRNPQEVNARFLELQMLKSNRRGIAYDLETEKPEFLSKNISGISELYQPLEDFFVAESRMVRSKIFGQAAREGLGNSGRGEAERYTHSQNLKRWQNDHYYDPLKRIFKLYFLSKSGITNGKLISFDLLFQIQIELTPLEIAQLQKLNIESMKLAVESGFVTAEQAAKALFGSNKIVLNPVISWENADPEIEEELTDEDYEDLIKSLDEDELESEENDSVNTESNTRVNKPQYCKACSEFTVTDIIEVINDTHELGTYLTKIGDRPIRKVNRSDYTDWQTIRNARIRN